METITKKIIKENQASIEVLCDLDDDGCVTIPPATAAGGVEDVPWESRDPKRHRVRVHRHYMVGNHDWCFHLQGSEFDRIRETLVRELGLANKGNVPFPRTLDESPELKSLCNLHNVFLRHGDIYDADNFDGSRDESSLGDAVVVELVVASPKKVEGIHSECAVELKEADNVRPLKMSPVWIASVVARTCRKPEDAKAVKRAWNELVNAFFALPFVKRHRSLRHWSTLFSLWLSKVLSLQLSSRILRSKVFAAISPATLPSYKDALGEVVTRGKDVLVVFGHTLVYQLVPLDSSGPIHCPTNQIYLNPGTWRP